MHKERRSMEFWILLWKTVFIVTISVYSVMAVWVTFQGARDIRSMLDDINDRHEAKKTTDENGA